MLTMEELRRRRAEILDLTRKHGLIGLPFSVQLPGERPAQTVVSIFWSASSPVPLFLITVPWSKTLRELLGLEVDVVTRNALKPRDELVCAEAIDL